MSRVGSVSINLDDVFGGLPALSTNVKIDSESISRSRKTTASSISTVKENKPQSVVSSHVTTTTVTRVSNAPAPQLVTAAAPPVTVSRHYDQPPTNYYDQTPSQDPLLDSIFSAVTLPTVNLNRHEDAISAIDEVLNGEDFGAYDHESIVSEPAYRAPTSHVSSQGSVLQRQPEYASEYHPQNTRSVVSNGSSKVNAANNTADAIPTNVFTGLNINSNQQYNAYQDEPNPDYGDEQSDVFDSHQQYEPKILQKSIRDRSNTIDSSVSYAESRFGNFVVHDDHGKYTGDEINLHHNEVAYERPESVVSGPGSHVSQYSQKSFHTGGTQKLRNLQRQVESARDQKAQLSHQVERQRADNDRLIQLNLAREASLKVNNVGNGTSKPAGYHVRSYSHDSQGAHSPQTPYNPYHEPSQTARSIDSSIYEEEETRVSKLAAIQKASGEHIANNGKFELIVPQYYVVEDYSRNNKINKVVIGGEAAPSDDDKTVLLFGPVGSGKTSAVTSMMNYLYDVKKENPFRFVLDEHVTPTTGLTVYVFNNTILPYNVTVVDTPGVVNKTGDRTVSELVREWLKTILLNAGSFRLDALSIVLRHDEWRLDWPFIHELAAVKEMFGDDLKTNVLPIITNAEVLPQPQAIKALTQANITFVEYYKVNNSGFAPLSKGVTKLQHNLFWTHGTASLENFFRDLQEQIHPLVAVLRHVKGRKVDPAPALAGKVLY